MFIESFSVKNFRNLSNVDIIPNRHLNIITGNNAQGKTNLIEGIYILTGCKSFRNSKESDYIKLGEPTANLNLKFQDDKRSQTIDCEFNRSRKKDKSYMLNGVQLKGTTSLFENFKCIVFMPEDIDLIKGSPDKRRNFIDMCYCQIVSNSVDRLRRLNLITSHRNAVIKEILMGKTTKKSLIPWNIQLAEVGSYISYMRYSYTKMLSEKATKLYFEISGNTENLKIEYQSNIFSEKDFQDGFSKKLSEKYLETLNNRIDDDIRAGYTLSGTPRDDITLKIDNLSVKVFGSQGQKKSTALVMKLAQADIFSKKTKETPIILLDDVMGELDIQRQKYICSMLKDTQVFITVCNEDLFVNRDKSKVFIVNNGNVTVKE